jgi:hypothetical protein
VRRGGSKLLVLLLVLTAVGIAIATRVIARGHDVQEMSAELKSVLAECRGKYQDARSAADSARVDAWVPRPPSGGHSGDPSCGNYRRRSMLGRG